MSMVICHTLMSSILGLLANLCELHTMPDSQAELYLNSHLVRILFASPDTEDADLASFEAAKKVQ